jgi:hypothetical protein
MSAGATAMISFNRTIPPSTPLCTVHQLLEARYASADPRFQLSTFRFNLSVNGS